MTEERVDLARLCERLGESDRHCTRPPTVDELEELDPRELYRLLHLVGLN